MSPWQRGAIFRVVGFLIVGTTAVACRTSGASKVADDAVGASPPTQPVQGDSVWQCRTRTVSLQFNEGLTISRSDQGYSAHFKYQRTPGATFETDVPVTRQAGGAQEVYTGPSFSLNITLESFAPTTHHPAKLAYANGSDRYDGPLLCTAVPAGGLAAEGGNCSLTSDCQSGLTCCPQGGGTVPVGTAAAAASSLICMGVQGTCPPPP